MSKAVTRPGDRAHQAAGTIVASASIIRILCENFRRRLLRKSLCRFDWGAPKGGGLYSTLRASRSHRQGEVSAP